MINKCIDKLKGKECKIISHEPGEEKAHVIFGMISEIDHESGFIYVESDQGIGCISINSIEAIKPNNKKH